MSTRKPPKKAAAKRTFARQRAEPVDLRTHRDVLTEQLLFPDTANDKEKMAEYWPNAEHALEHERTRAEAGDKRAVLRAIYICSIYNMPMPDWTRRAFLAAYNAILNVDAKSWDDVFGRAFPKGVHWNELKKHAELKNAVYREMCLANIEGESLTSSKPKKGKSSTDGAFEKVANKLNISPGTVIELFYEAKSEHDYWPGND